MSFFTGKKRNTKLEEEKEKRSLPRRIGTAVALVICLLLPLAELLVMDYYNYSGDMPRYIEHFHLHPDTFCFEVLVMYTIFFTLLFLLRRMYLTSFIMTSLALICSFVHYLKVSLNGDPFMPNDLIMVKDAGQLLGFMENADFPPYFRAVAAAALVLMILLFPARKRLRIRSRKVMLLGLLLLGISLHFVFNTQSSTKLLEKFHMGPNNAALQFSNYSANGFVGGFTINVFQMYVKKPAGYSEEAVNALLEPYQDAAETKTEAGTGNDGAKNPSAKSTGPNKQPDVILVLSESFTDIREVDQLEFSRNPLDNYDSIRKSPNCMSGMLSVTAFEGGTVRPEFEILTGMTTDAFPGGFLPYSRLRHPVETYVSRYRDAGYYTLAIHPYYMKFYDRYYSYEYLGFDDFYGEGALTEQFGDIITYSPQHRVTDMSLAKMIGQYLDDSEKPCFLFTITMENHQPYLEIEDKSQQNVTVTCSDEKLDPQDLVMINTYTSNLYDADRMLGDLRTIIDRRKDPTMLVFYGDHRPNLNEAYADLGTLAKDGKSLGNWEKLYSAPFVIYANFPLDDERCMLDIGTDNRISTYNLLNAAAQASDMEQSPYMRLLEDYYKVQPYYNRRLDIPLKEEAVPYNEAMHMITYDRMFGNNYSSVLK